MRFPRLVYTCPGQEVCQGGTYSALGVTSQAEYDAALRAGYHATLPAALAGHGTTDDPIPPVTPQKPKTATRRKT